MQLWYVSSLIGLFLLSSCSRDGVDYNNLASSSGKKALITNEFKGVVKVLGPDRSMCTGVLIHSRAVITAAHCLLASGTYSIRSYQGSFSTSEKVILGSGDVNDPNDIALLIFENDIEDPTSSNIYHFAKEVSLRSTVTIVGYGCTDRDSKLGSGLKRVATNILNDISQDYFTLYTPEEKNSPEAIIGDSTQGGSCFGDSGGPLFSLVNGEYLLAAITHAGGTENGFDFSEYVIVSSQNSKNYQFLRSNSQKWNFAFDWR